jgi:predicted phage terminase large subunit-like protein
MAQTHHWSRAHDALAAAIRAKMRRETRPFGDNSPEAIAARKALPFDEWMHTYFPHYASCQSSPLHLLADQIVEEKGIPTAEFWFRGAGKTTRALLRRIRRILEPTRGRDRKLNPRKARFIIVGALTEDRAAEKIDLIKLELVNNSRLRQDYGDEIGPKPGANEDTDWIANGTRVLARGIGQSCRGLTHGPHRPDDFLGDDLEDDQLARNPEREKHLWEWLFGNVYPAISGAGQDGWCEILLNNYGTRHGLKQHFQEEAAKPNPVFKYIEFLAEDERGESAWPQMYPTWKLRRAAAIAGRALYGREWLGKAYSEDDVFRAEWIDKGAFDSTQFIRGEALVRVAVDPSATAKETSDYKVVIVLARPKGTRDICCLHAWIRRASPNELIDEILRVHDRFLPGRIGCEANGFQTLIWPLLEANEKIRGRVERLGLFPITNAASKEDRILSLQPDFEQGLVHLDEGEGDQRMLIDQFLDFGKPGVHDDGPDAFEMARRLFPQFEHEGKPRDLIMRVERRENFSRAFAGAGAAIGIGASDRDEDDIPEYR